MKKLGLIFLGLTFLGACAHHRDVRPGVDGIHIVKVTTDDKEAGSRDAISQANNYCEESKKQAAFINEDQKYTGDMDEDTYKTGKRISKAAEMVGGTVWTMGGKRESNAGGVIGLGGATADSVLGKGYTVTMKFKCQ